MTSWNIFTWNTVTRKLNGGMVNIYQHVSIETTRKQTSVYTYKLAINSTCTNIKRSTLFFLHGCRASTFVVLELFQGSLQNIYCNKYENSISYEQAQDDTCYIFRQFDSCSLI